jgi:hypothetical protein
MAGREHYDCWQIQHQLGIFAEDEPMCATKESREAIEKWQ